MPHETVLFVLIIITGLYMAWNIGANDVANAMGTSVGSGALTLRQAVLVAAVLEFSGAFFFGSHVSETVQSGIVDTSIFADQPLIIVFGMLASLAAAGAWLQIASYYGWPVSTTHTIVGAIVGFGVVSGGWDAIYWTNVSYIVSSWLFSPILGGILSFGIFTILRKYIFYAPRPFEAAKKLTPFIVFVFVTVLSLIMVNNGLKNLHLDFTSFEIFLLSIGIGASAGLICYLIIRKLVLKVPKALKARPFTDPEIGISLQKAAKHLQKAQATSTGDMHYQVAFLLDEVESLQKNAQQPDSSEHIGIQTAAIERMFSYLQIMSACLMAFAHGANDVANAIGPLSASINVLKTGVLTPNTPIPVWALALGGVGIVTGLATWGWRVIETIGKKITELTPTRGFAAEFGAATTIVLASKMGLPISTTHTLVGAVLGVGLARGIEALNLTMLRDIVISWVVTVPAGACITIVLFFLLKGIFG